MDLSKPVFQEQLCLLFPATLDSWEGWNKLVGKTDEHFDISANLILNVLGYLGAGNLRKYIHMHDVYDCKKCYGWLSSMAGVLFRFNYC